MILNEKNIGKEFERWFSKSIIHSDDIDFNDKKKFLKSLNQFIFDYKKYFNDNKIMLERILSRHELIGILLYRVGRNYFLQNQESISSKYSSLGTFLSGFEIYYTAKIGESLKINHGLGLVIGARTVIGDNALLHHGVALGDKDEGRPTLKNNVTVYAGAKILGNVIVGNNSVVGVNCVCLINVPDNAAVIGIPGKLIN